MSVETAETRIEHDLLGAGAVPRAAPWGVHTARALEYVPLAGRPVHPSLVYAYGQVKEAACLTPEQCDRLSSSEALHQLGFAVEEA